MPCETYNITISNNKISKIEGENFQAVTVFWSSSVSSVLNITSTFLDGKISVRYHTTTTSVTASAKRSKKILEIEMEFTNRKSKSIIQKCNLKRR